MLTLKIVSPERIVYDGEAKSVTVPGVLGSFQVLENHAPIISALDEGKVIYVTPDGERTMDISGGFIEVHDNEVSLVAEVN